MKAAEKAKSLERRLRSEIEKWSKKLGEELTKVLATCKSGEEILRNARAYFSDSKHFLEKGDLIRAFECLIWAWAWIEIGKEMGKIKRKNKSEFQL